MKSAFLYLFALAVLSGAGCQSKTKLSETGQGQELQHLPLQSIIVMKQVVPEDIRQDPFSLKTAELLGKSVLKMEVAYSGGCREHQIELYFTTFLNDAKSPRVSSFIAHNGNNDPCDGWESKTLYFDLSELARTCRSQLGVKTSKLSISFLDSNNEEKELVFHF